MCTLRRSILRRRPIRQATEFHWRRNGLRRERGVSSTAAASLHAAGLIPPALRFDERPLTSRWSRRRLDEQERCGSALTDRRLMQDSPLCVQTLMAGVHMKFKSPIATRHLARTDTGAAVTVQLARPRQRRTGEFECPYRLRGLGRVKLGRALGEDSVQALQLAFEAVRLELEPHAATLSWYGERGETGFPQYVPYTFGGRFRKRLEAMVRREIEREAEQLEHRSKARRKASRDALRRGAG